MRIEKMDELDSVFGSLASYFSILAEPARLKIMHAICEGERTVNEIVGDTGISQTNVSRHLGLMHRQGVVLRRRDGKQIYYRVADETMPELCRAVCARMARTLDERGAVKRQLLKLMPAPKRRAA
jgi:DNA-binding transcriptional ArsR family regulator